MNKKLLILFTIVILGTGVYFYDLMFLSKDEVGILNTANVNEKSVKESTGKTGNACLKENELADYLVSKDFINKKLKWSESPATVTVVDKDNKSTINKFNIENISNSIFTLWLMPCGVYANRYFNYDYGAHEGLSGFRSELWKYDYGGNGKFLFTIYDTRLDNSNGNKTRFGPSFAIDPKEKYVALVKQEFLKQRLNESVVIKNLNTFENIFEFSGKELIKEYPNLNSSFEIGDNWSNDGRFFWVGFSDPFYGDIYFDVFVRIDTVSGQHQVFEKPAYSDALNSNNGYITYMKGGEFLFEEPSAQQIKEWKDKGNFVSFYLYNLITEEEILLEKGDNPTYDYQPKWPDENTLQYKMPNGPTKVYKLNI